MADQKTTDTAEKAFAEASAAAVSKPIVAATPANIAAAKPVAKKTPRKPAAKTARKPATKRVAVSKKPAIKRAAKRAAPIKSATKSGAKAMNDTIKTLNQTARKTADQGRARIDTMITETTTQSRAAFERNNKVVKDLADFSKGNVEAIVESGKIAVGGIQKINSDAVEFGRKSFENATAAVKTYAGAKNATDLMKLQGDFARTSFDQFFAQASKNSEAMLKLAGEAFQPISNRLAVAATKIKTAA